METKPNREITDLVLALKLEATRAATVEKVVRAYEKHRDIGRTAEDLKVSRKTLSRAISAYPELKQAIDRVRVAGKILP